MPKEGRDASSRRTLLIAYLPREANSAALQATMEHIGGGEVTCRVMMDMPTRRSKCFGFAMFHSPKCAARVLDACRLGKVRMQDHQGKSWHLKAEYARDEMRLHGPRPQGVVGCWCGACMATWLRQG